MCERERRYLILGGAREARGVRDVARRRRGRIVAEVNGPSSTPNHDSFSLLHLSRFDYRSIFLRSSRVPTAMSNSTLLLFVAFRGFVFSDIMYCFGPVLFWTLYDIYKSLSNLNPTELGLFFSGPGFKLLKDWFHDGGQCNINESQERSLQFSHI